MIILSHMGECVVYNRKEYVELMKSTQKMTEEELKTLADKYDSVYLHPVSRQVFTSPVLIIPVPMFQCSS